VHFVGDALSARGITVSGAHGIYVAESIISPQKGNMEIEDEWDNNVGDIIYWK
jgi:hypothetical protein